MKTIALASILGAAHSAKVTCHFTADNYIHEVYVDGVDKIKAGEVKCALTGWTKQKTVEFDSSATTLAVHASDAERGCRNGGFIMQCETDDSSSPWNMDTQNSRAFFEVASKRLNHKGHAALQNQAPPSTNWMKTDYETDHAVWETPRQTNHRWMRGSRWGGIDINGGICSGESQSTYNNVWWLRYNINTVKCDLTADNYVHKIYIDGEDMKHRVFGSMNDWYKKKYIRFDSSAKSIAVHASDAERGCRNGGFMMACSTPVKTSVWNTNTEANIEDFTVASKKMNHKGRHALENAAPPAANWYKNDYYAIGKQWDTPRRTSHHWMRNRGININHGICAGKSQDSTNNNWWIRLEHKTEGHPSNCLEWDCTAWCKYWIDEDEANDVYSILGCGGAGEGQCFCE